MAVFTGVTVRCSVPGLQVSAGGGAAAVGLECGVPVALVSLGSAKA